MSGFSADLSPAATTRAIEENGAECLLALGRAGGGEERHDAQVQWVIGGSPLDYHNCVVRADLPLEAVVETIELVKARLRAHKVPGTWHVGPGMRPADLGERLEAEGFVHEGDDIGMAVDLGALREDLRAPAGLSVERVRDERALALWVLILGSGFGEGPREAEWIGEMYRRIGLSDDVPWRHYLAWLEGQPVAVSSLFLAAGVAGIYFVATTPTQRRRGIGAALTLAPLQEARSLGYRTGVLGASPMGYPVYLRLGFREYCRIGIYIWGPPPISSSGRRASSGGRRGEGMVHYRQGDTPVCGRNVPETRGISAARAQGLDFADPNVTELDVDIPVGACPSIGPNLDVYPYDAQDNRLSL